jgi:hypothetical protein
MPGARRTHGFVQKKHEVVTTGLPDSTRHSLHNGFTVSFVLSPVTGFIATVACGYFHELDASIGASGPHDFAVRVSAVRLRAPHASIASRTQRP